MAAREDLNRRLSLKRAIIISIIMGGASGLFVGINESNIFYNIFLTLGAFDGVLTLILIGNMRK